MRNPNGLLQDTINSICFFKDKMLNIFNPLK